MSDARQEKGKPVAKRPIRTMRRHELVAEAKRLGIAKPNLYNVDELRPVVGARIAQEAGR